MTNDILDNADRRIDRDIEMITDNLATMNVTLSPHIMLHNNTKDVPYTRSIEDYIKLRAYREFYTETSTLDEEMQTFNCSCMVDGISTLFDSLPYVHTYDFNTIKPKYAIVSAAKDYNTVFAYCNNTNKYLQDITANDTNATLSYTDLVYALALSDNKTMLRNEELINRSFNHLREKATDIVAHSRMDSETVKEYAYRMNMLTELNNCSDILLTCCKEQLAAAEM